MQQDKIKVVPSTSKKRKMIITKPPLTTKQRLLTKTQTIDIDKLIGIPKQDKVNITLIYPITDSINGGTESYRWGGNPPKGKAKTQKAGHKESFIDNGLLSSFPVIQMPCDYDAILDGNPHTYKKGDYVTIDFNGRLRTALEMTREGYRWGTLEEYEALGKPEDYGTHVPIDDVTDLVLNGSTTIDKTVLEDLWDNVIAMSTGAMDWNMFQFINSGANVITDPAQSEVWKYLRDKMSEMYLQKVSNKNVLFATLGAMPEFDEIRNKTLDYDMNACRYSNAVLENFARLRFKLGKNQLPGPFLDVVGGIFVEFMKNGYLCAEEYALVHATSGRGKLGGKLTAVKGTLTKHFNLEDKLYSDKHYNMFERYIEFLCDKIEFCVPIERTTGERRYPGGRSASRIWIREHIALWEEECFSKNPAWNTVNPLTGWTK